MKLYGKNSVLEALRNDNVTVLKVMIDENQFSPEAKEAIKLCKERSIKFSFVNKQTLEREIATPESKGQRLNHQGIIAETTSFKYADLADILSVSDKKQKDAFIVILDEISDPHNLGAIIRVCECAGVDGIILPKNNGAQVNETVLKTSSGAASYIKICEVVNITETIKLFKKQNIFVFAVELGGQNLYKTNLTGKIALVIGNEGKGIRKLVKETCDDVVTLPMLGKVNSLNASVACGAAVFEAVRQRT